MRKTRLLKVISVISAGALLLSACSSGGEAENGNSSNSGDQTLKIWHYESEDSAMGKAWDAAIEIFKEENPDVTVTFERKAYEQISQNAGMILGTDEAPDVMEYDKGNANIGLLSRQGLLTDISSEVSARGWDQVISPTMALTAKYDQGLMGSGPWYGVTNYGEYSMVYYNKDMFADVGVTDIPTTIAELEAAMQKFVDAGITPLITGGSEYPLMELFYDLAMVKADEQFIKDYQFFENEVDFNSEPFTYAAQKLDEWITKGYLATESAAMTAEDMGVSFISGEVPMMVSGSWWYGRLKTEVQYDWSSFLFPEATYTSGSSGNLWVIPERSTNKELAYEFIDITLRPEIQNIMANNGGLPVSADLNEVTDAKDKELIANFNTLLERDGLGFYLAWPVAGFGDTWTSTLQSILSKSKPIPDALQFAEDFYLEGKADIVG